MKKNNVVISLIIISIMIVGLITVSCFFSGNKEKIEEETDTIAIFDDNDAIIDDTLAVDSACIIDEVDELEIPTNNPDNEEY